MNKYRIVLLKFLIVLFVFNLNSCSRKKLNDLEIKMLGTWNKDWNKSIKYIESKPELSKYLLGLKMVASMQKSHKYIFNKNMTFELTVGEEQIAEEKRKGDWNISKDSILSIITKNINREGLFIDKENKSNNEMFLKFKIINIDSNFIELRQIKETTSELPEFMTKS